MDYIGFFEPLFFMYGEDNNYLQRVVFHNFKIGITPLTTICHDRKFRKAFMSIDLNQNKIDFLIDVLNPNNPFVKAYSHMVMRIGAKAIVYFIELQFKQLIYILAFFVHTLFSCRKYLNARNSY